MELLENVVPCGHVLFTLSVAPYEKQIQIYNGTFYMIFHHKGVSKLISTRIIYQQKKYQLLYISTCRNSKNIPAKNIKIQRRYVEDVIGMIKIGGCYVFVDSLEWRQLCRA